MNRSRCPSRGADRLLALTIALTLLLIAAPPALAQTPIRIIFLHHSVGQGLIDQGGVREGLAALGYEFYDHGYNGDGLRLADGSATGTNFDVPDDNTDPDGLANIFGQALHDPPDNTFSLLMQYDVILTKSCFPTSNIADDAQLDSYKSSYLSMRDRMDQFPDKLFILVTSPPQVPGSSNPEEAARARAFSQWLGSDEFLAGHPNVFVFDFFDRLAGDDNFLRWEYRVDNTDAHPNEAANQAIGPEFVTFIDEAIRGYGLEPGGGEIVAPPTQEEAVELPSSEAVAPVAGVIEDFETLAAPWAGTSDQPESIIECGADSGFAHTGASSLRVHYEIAPDGWAECGQTFEAAADWSGGEGISLWLLADSEGQWITLGIYSGEGDAARPFELSFETTAEHVAGWTQLVYSWDELPRAGWADEGGLEVIDPARIDGYWFSTGAGGDGSEGIFWVDSLALNGPAPPDSAPAAGEEAAPAGSQASEESGGGGSTCPLGMVLPLGVLGLIIVRRRGQSALSDSSSSDSPLNSQ